MGERLKAAIDKVEDDTLEELLSECTSEQRKFFNRIYPNGVPRDKMVTAIDICERTIKKNRGF